MNLHELAAQWPPEAEPALCIATMYLLAKGYPYSLAIEFLRRARNGEEPPTYLEVLKHGQKDTLRTALLRLGTRRFGPPDKATSDTL